MKLLTHTSLFWITMSMVLFFLYGVSFYFVFRELSTNRLENELIVEKEKVMNSPAQYLDILNSNHSFIDHIIVDTIDIAHDHKLTFFDSLAYNNSTQVIEPVRCIQFETKVDSVSVRFQIHKSTISSDKFTERIVFLFGLIAILYALGLYILNRHVFTRTWKGFYSTLRKLKKFRAGKEVPDFEEDEIDEFEDLNIELRRMIKRISSDYHNLKSFTSHATHELQTPTAVIQSKAELLLQNESLTEQQLSQVNSIVQYTRQLSRTTQALSLLFKIDNQQFTQGKAVCLNDILNKNEEFLKDQCEAKNLDLKLIESAKLSIKIHYDLADVMIGNLLRNAIFHNQDGGSIKIHINSNILVISNTGSDLPLDEKKIFNDFYKGEKSGGLGLGLAIAHKIAIKHDLKLSYIFENNMHQFSLSL